MAYTLTQVTKNLTRVNFDNSIEFGWVRRHQYEATARGSYFPATTTRVEWIATKNGESIGAYATRKAAAEAVESMVRNIW